jgi:hypothetical protein
MWNLICLGVAIWAVVSAIAQNIPAQDPKYIPPMAFASSAFFTGIFPIVSVIVLVQYRRRRARQRRAIASDSSGLLPQSVD